jgi:hypothetical protein
MKARLCATADTLAILMALTLSLPALAAAPTTFVTDPAGDANYKAPGYMDIIRAEISKDHETFVFQMRLAEVLTAAPPAPPPGNNGLAWVWSLDTDPATFPAGTPLAPGNGQRAPAELAVYVFWDGSAFSAFLQDRRPLLTGGAALVTSLPFTISGADLRVTAGATLLGNPSSFSWAAITAYWSGTPFSTSGFHFVDALQPVYNPWPS